MPTTLTTVVCSECRRENEPERVYCHACGARLDRSAVRVHKEPPEDAQKRVKKIFKPRFARIRAFFFQVSKVTLGASGAAVVVMLFLPPDLPPPNKTAMLASQIRLDLEGATARHQPAEMSYTEEQINGFLVYALKPKQKSLDEPLLDFKRAVVQFREGTCAVTVERSLFGLSLFTNMSMTPSIKAGKIVVVSRGGSIGRLPVHPEVARYMGVLFADVRGALDRETKLLAKMGTMEFHDKSVFLTAPQ